jgi:hypothetical protein
MKIDIFSVLIIVVYAYVLSTIKSTDYSRIACITLLLVVLLYMRRDNLEPYTLDSQYNARVVYDDVNHDYDRDKLEQKNKRDRVDSVKAMTYENSGNMSNLDGVCLSTGNADSWMKSPSNLELNSNKDLYNIQGHTNPNKPVISDPTSLSGPPIDGNDDSPHKLFMLANNKVSPECCPSSYTTSTGCLCSTKEQRRYVASRGNNIRGCDNTTNI